MIIINSETEMVATVAAPRIERDPVLASSEDDDSETPDEDSEEPEEE